MNIYGPYMSIYGPYMIIYGPTNFFAESMLHPKGQAFRRTQAAWRKRKSKKDWKSWKFPFRCSVPTPGMMVN